MKKYEIFYLANGDKISTGVFASCEDEAEELCAVYHDLDNRDYVYEAR